ncbi:hypothetical protein KC356_g7 [Hortaea werneckii]|nr:hypothetical protein KC356_g7 [Hortaea werneckii]
MSAYSLHVVLISIKAFKHRNCYTIQRVDTNPNTNGSQLALTPTPSNPLCGAHHYQGMAKITVENDLPAEVESYLAELTKRLVDHFQEQLVGVYLFGSASCKAYEPGVSDLDVQAVVQEPLSDVAKQAIVSLLNQDALPCPATKLEFVLYARDVVHPASRHPRFELNLNTGPNRCDHIGLDPAKEASHWFLLDIAFGRELGRCLYGVDKSEAFGAIPHSWDLAVCRLRKICF